MRYCILEWITGENPWLTHDIDGNEASGIAIFKSKELAQDFAETHCAFNWKIVLF